MGECQYLRLILFNHNYVWANSGWGQTVCKWRRAKITRGENNPVYSILHFSLLIHSLIFTGHYSKCITMISLSLLDILWYLRYKNNVKTFCKDFESYRNTPQDVIKIISQIKFAIVIFHEVELITWLLKMFHLTLLNLRAISHLKHCNNLKNWQTNSQIIVRETPVQKWRPLL